MTVIIALVLGGLAVWLTKKALSAPVYPSVVTGGGQSDSRDVDIEKGDETTQITKSAHVVQGDSILVDVPAVSAPVVAETPKATKVKRPAKKTPKTVTKAAPKKSAKKQTKATKRK